MAQVKINLNSETNLFNIKKELGKQFIGIGWSDDGYLFYRDLILSLASNSKLVKELGSGGTNRFDLTGEIIIQQADAIIKELMIEAKHIDLLNKEESKK